MSMELFIVQFYDANESGSVEHNEVYTMGNVARNRFDFLKEHLNCYSWVYLYEGIIIDDRVQIGDCIEECRSCEGEDDWYHGDDTDF